MKWRGMKVHVVCTCMFGHAVAMAAYTYAGKESPTIQGILSYKSVPWSTWPRAFSDPFAEDNASYSSQPQGQKSQSHESLPF